MKIAVVGGTGAMGSVLGATLCEGGHDVTLVDVAQNAVDRINTSGLVVENKAGETRTVAMKATTKPADVGVVDVAIVFVKCYHTENAVRAAAPMLGADTLILSLQNGWGNAPRIAEIVGRERVLVGVTYHSATLTAPGHVKHAGVGNTFVGELEGDGARAQKLAQAFNDAAWETTATDRVLDEIWKKLALNVCTLPTSALLRFTADELIKHDGTLQLMKALLRETVAVANAQNIALDFDERWAAITGLLEKAIGAKSSMLQDVEKNRRTEIDVINGAIVEAGQRLHIPTPHNDSMLWLTKALEETF